MNFNDFIALIFIALLVCFVTTSIITGFLSMFIRQNVQKVTFGD